MESKILIIMSGKGSNSNKKGMKGNFIVIIILLLFAAFNFSVMASPPKIIAHRGYWKAEGSAQNSIRSLIKADSIGCYASELDIWMTADGVLIVNHDSDLNGVIIENSHSDEILNQKLDNGELVPTLDDYLGVASGLPIRLVCEIKSHNNREGEKIAIKKILELVDKYNLRDKVDYITFSKDGFKNFINLSPSDANIYYLEGDYLPAQILFEGGRGIDYHIGVLKQHPEWIEESHRLGLFVNVWTVDSEDDMQWCIDHNVDFITTNEPEKLQILINKTN